MCKGGEEEGEEESWQHHVGSPPLFNESQQAMSRLAPVARRLCTAPPKAHSVRWMSAEAAALAPSKEAATVVTPVKPPVAVPLSPLPKRGSTLMDRVWAFFVGVGVSGIVCYFKVADDVAESTHEVRRARC